MRMMYGVIAQELKSAQLENAHPTDYLNFYCLGKREGHHKEESSSEARVIVLHFFICCFHRYLFYSISVLLLLLD